MSTESSNREVSRRAALVGLGGGALGMGLVAPNHQVGAQTEAGALAGHPIAGTWLVNTPGGISPATFSADGSVVLAVQPSYVDPALGVTLQGPALGRWEPSGERSGRFTVVQSLSDADGTYLGTFLFDSSQEVSDDGQTFISGQSQRVILRDAANTILMDEVFSMDPPVTGTRVGATIESVVFPAATPAAGTPTS